MKLNNINNRRGLAVAIVITSFFLVLLDIKLPILYDLLLRSYNTPTTYICVSSLIFPALFFIGKYYNNKEKYFYLSIGWLAGIILFRLKEDHWHFYNLKSDMLQYITYGLIGLSISGFAYYLLKGISTEKQNNQPSITNKITTNENKNIKFESIGGFLIILGCFLIIAPVSTIFELYNSLHDLMLIRANTLHTSVFELSIHNILPLAIIGFGFTFFILELNLIYLFSTRNKAFPKWFLFVIIFELMLILVARFINYENLSEENKAVIDLITMRRVIIDLFWGLYITLSKRVKSTFIK